MLRPPRATFLRQDGAEAAMDLLAWVWGPGPPLLLIQAGRDRENVLISASPMPNIREYLHTDWGPLRSQIY